MVKRPNHRKNWIWKEPPQYESSPEHSASKRNHLLSKVTLCENQEGNTRHLSLGPYSGSFPHLLSLELQKVRT